MLKQMTLFHRAMPGTAAERILDLLSDHKWHGYHSISVSANQSGRFCRDPIRRVRELRELGYTISKRRCENDSLSFEYRLERE